MFLTVHKSNFHLKGGILRTTSSLLYELRSAIFNPMAQNAVRSLTCKTFSHLLKMDYAYLLTQNTGAISRAIDRGQRSIYYIINSTIFNILPTILQIALVCYLLGNSCGSTFSFITMGTIGVYFLFTLSVTEWRTKLRKELNRLDSVASSKAIDTIMNFETIKVQINTIKVFQQ
ncbi:ATP-binding cassette sub- B member 7, mitochondrial, variant 2 [Bonamia ostreae]|uniref:ATP-binding cassette sub- B member 7, mitochondrial, variant 2 n=1 Tax=Bonamia ostreae TaxID=126728 RepID=A0ABV2AJD2_9EUKA